MVGDIVRVRYVCILTDTNKTVMSTKHTLERPWVEFVLGVDQVIKGFDRALPMMSVGERSKIIMSPEYGCE
jgi:FKBP-type peptidyl-prolyl cis-trans isomerase